MKPFGFLFALLFAATVTHAQQVIASSGNSGSAAGYTVDWTIGEPVIETIEGSANIITQGMHQTNLLVTALTQFDIPGLELKVYPNPTGRFLKIEVIQTGNELFLYKLSDITGRKTILKEMHSNAEEIDMGSYVSGIYFLHVLNRNHEFIKVFKIIKN